MEYLQVCVAQVFAYNTEQQDVSANHDIDKICLMFI